METVYGKIEDDGCGWSHPGFTASEVEDICNKMRESDSTLYDVVGDVAVEEALLRDLLAAAEKKA